MNVYLYVLDTMADWEVAYLLAAKERITSGGRVAAICGATVGLAAVGALDGVEHTSIDPEYLKMVCPGYAGQQYFKNELVVSSGSLVTASGFAPIEFARDVLALLEVFKPETLDAWYNLNVKKEGRYYFALMESMV